MSLLAGATTAFNTAKKIKPATQISTIVDAIPGARKKLNKNTAGKLFLGGLNVAKKLGFGVEVRVTPPRKSMRKRGRAGSKSRRR